MVLRHGYVIPALRTVVLFAEGVLQGRAGVGMQQCRALPCRQRHLACTAHLLSYTAGKSQETRLISDMQADTTWSHPGRGFVKVSRLLCHLSSFVFLLKITAVSECGLVAP